MAAKVVYQSTGHDGHAAGYVEIMVDSASDLTGVKISDPASGNINPAPGSVAYTAGCEDVWHLNNDGSWVKF